MKYKLFYETVKNGIYANGFVEMSETYLDDLAKGVLL